MRVMAMQAQDQSFMRDPALQRPLVFTLGHSLHALGLSLTLYAFLASSALLLSRSGLPDATCLGLVHVASAASLATFWRFGRWGRARFDSFGAALLLFAIAWRLQALIDTGMFGTRAEEIYLYPSVPLPQDMFLLFLKAETITLVGLLLVACAWRLRVGGAVAEYSFMTSLSSVPPQTPLIVYLASLGLDASIRIFGVSFGPLTQFSSTLFMIGMASIYFVASRRSRPFGKVLVAMAMGLPMTALALNKGMKSEMFFPMIPAAVLFWTGYRILLVRAIVVIVSVLVLMLSQMYVHYVRTIAWDSGAIRKVSPIDLVSGFIEQLPQISVIDALNSTSSRVNLTVTHAITVTLADQHGFEPLNVFGPIPGTFVPRFAWPGKPVLQPGAMHTARILGIDVPLSEITSATAAGFSTELYLGGWWVGLVLGALAYGGLLASAQRRVHRISPGFSHLAFCFLAAYWAFRFDENHVVYAYTGVVFFVAFLWLLRKVTSLFGLR